MLPKRAHAIIDEVIKSETYSLRGNCGYAQNGNIKIWYEYLPTAVEKRGTILLIMGLANDSLTWSYNFIDLLRAGGYDIVRYDNRDVGMSTWTKDWKKESAYDLKDMASDGIAVLDHLQLSTAHLVGVSMGGMIAQTMAIHFPDRILSMCSMMSSGFAKDKTVTQPDKWMLTKYLYSQALYGLKKSEKNIIKMHLSTWHLLRGKVKYDINIKAIASTVLKNLRDRKGYNSKSPKQQLAAIYKSGSRFKQLENLSTPTLIIHGIEDPLVSIEHGYKCAKLIKDVQTLWIKGMGHTLPDKFYEVSTDAIISRIEES